MKIFLRILSTIIEITIAVAIFVIIIQETPLFDRAIPWRNDTSDHSTWTQILTNITWTTIKNTTYTNQNNTTTSWTKIVTLSTTRYSREIIDQPVILWNSCVTPQWQIIDDNQSIIAYFSPIANSKNECQSEIRVCKNGKISGSYTYQTCDYMIDGRITRTIGGKIVTVDYTNWASDRDQTFIDLADYLAAKKRKEEYIQPSQEPDQTPLTIAQIRAQTMSNSDIKQPARDLTDTLDQTNIRDIDTTTYQTCRTPRWTSIKNWSFVYAYDRSNSDIYNDCNIQKRACIDWKLSGSFQYKNCDLWSSQINNNTAIITSTPSTIYQWTPLVAPPYVRPFSESVLDTFKITYKKSDLPSTSISTWWQNYIEFADCTTPRWTSIKHHQRVIAYRLPSETANSLCNPEPRVCRDGILWWTYTYPSCTEVQPTPHQQNWLQTTAQKIGNWWRWLW